MNASKLSFICLYQQPVTIAELFLIYCLFMYFQREVGRTRALREQLEYAGEWSVISHTLSQTPRSQVGHRVTNNMKLTSKDGGVNAGTGKGNQTGFIS